MHLPCTSTFVSQMKAILPLPRIAAPDIPPIPRIMAGSPLITISCCPETSFSPEDHVSTQVSTERFSGLVRYDGTPKVAASVLRSEPGEGEKKGISFEWIDLSQEEYYQNPGQHLKRLYRRFREYYSFP